MPEAMTTSETQQREPATGSTIAGRFVLRELLGEGSTARVYRADDRQAGGRVAVKVLLARHRGQALEYRLLDEGEYLRRIGSAKHVVDLIECGQADDHDGWPFVALELLEGRTLREHALSANSLSTALVVSHARQIVAALGECHRAHVVHRDLTPANLMVFGDPRTATCKLRLFDFSHAGASNGPRLPPGHPDRLTTEFELVGTPRYIPPEQARANPAVAAMDVFALGVVLWELLVGDNPFAAIVEPGEFVARQRRGGVPVPRLEASPRIPDTLARLVNDCLVHEPKLRPSLDAVAERLDHLHAELSRTWRSANDSDRTDEISPEELARFLSEVNPAASSEPAPPPASQPPASQPPASQPPASSASLAEGRDKTDAISPEALARARSGAHAAASERTDAISPEALEQTRGERPPSPPAVEPVRSAFAREDAPPVILPSLPEPSDDDDDDLASFTPSRRWLPISLLALCLALGVWWVLGRDEVGEAEVSSTSEPKASEATPTEATPTEPPNEPPNEPDPSEPDPNEVDPSEPAPSEPAPSHTKSGQPGHGSPECAKVRDDAAAALANKQWDKAERLARRSSCWSSSVERLRIRVRALAESERYADCVRVGGDHSDKDIQKWVNICRRAQ